MIDLRLKFDMGKILYNEKTFIIVVVIDSEDGTILIGIVVDAVSEILNIQENEIEETPAFGTKLDTGYILGMAKTENGVKILLNIDRVLNKEDLTQLKKVV